MNPIKKTSLVDQVYEKIRKDIITLQLPLGSKVNVNELQPKLGVSCTPIREAINRLQQEGVIEYEVNVGAHVLTLTKHDVVEIQQLAMTLHCAAIRLAMEQGDQGKIAADFAKYLEEYRKAATINSEVNAVNRMMGTFYHNCRNKRLDRSMISIQGQQLLLRYAYASCIEARGTDIADYERMLQGISDEDATAVCRALEGTVGKMTTVLCTEFVSAQ